MPKANLEVFIPLDQCSADLLADRGLIVKQTTDDGYIVEMTARNRYRGDDETIVFCLWNDSVLDGIEGWKINWDNSTY